MGEDMELVEAFEIWWESNTHPGPGRETAAQAWEAALRWQAAERVARKLEKLEGARSGKVRCGGCNDTGVLENDAPCECTVSDHPDDAPHGTYEQDMWEMP